jgi:RND family efflux transporter MFP subunit
MNGRAVRGGFQVVAIGKDGAVLRQLSTLFNVGTVRELGDGQLLERFATDRGDMAELAFSVLVERHGPMVLRVCRGVLADTHDAQDAFQATFLVLVRKARALWVRDSLGPWLHQVAYRTACCARSAAARRKHHEQRAAVPEGAARVETVSDLEPVLHEEINRLPERYRAPLVLCDLQACTHEQAARHLGLPVGTVKSRLSRARERLRGRLLRRGLTADAGLIAAALKIDAASVSISSALVSLTAGTAARLLTVRGFVPCTATTLAQGVLRTMSITQWMKAASVLLVAGATVAGVEVLVQRGTSGAQAQTAEKPKAAATGDAGSVEEVRPGPLKVSVVDRGYLESSRNQDVYCLVEGQTTIIAIKPEGTRVKKGEIICKLDSAALKDQLVNQRIRSEQAKSNYQNAKLVREVAEIAVTEYIEGIYAQKSAVALAEVRTAEAALKNGESRLQRTRRARKQLEDALARKGVNRTAREIVTELDLDDRIEAVEQTLSQTRMALEQAQNKRAVLDHFTKPKTIKELVSEVEKAKSDELFKQAAWELEKSKEAKLERQIAWCTLTAPQEGLIVYANDPTRGFGRTRPQIEEGATIRERQKIISIPDLTHMQVNAKVREAEIDKIIPKMKVKIRVDAFPDQLLDGTVLDVAPLPDPGNFFNNNIKVYTTHVKIPNPLPGFRPGMTAQVEILVTELDNVLSVPIPSVIRLDSKHHVFVKKTSGGLELRQVELGVTNGERIVVKQGLQSGETVMFDPLPLLTREQRARVNPLFRADQIAERNKQMTDEERAKFDASKKSSNRPRSIPRKERGPARTPDEP